MAERQSPFSGTPFFYAIPSLMKLTANPAARDSDDSGGLSVPASIH